MRNIQHNSFHKDIVSIKTIEMKENKIYIFQKCPINHVINLLI